VVVPSHVVEIVNDDMPFLVDSASMEVNRQGLTLHLIVHPIFAVERDAAGAGGLFPREERPDGARESFMHIEVDRLADPMARAQLAEGSNACSATCVRPSPTGRRWWRSCAR